MTTERAVTKEKLKDEICAFMRDSAIPVTTAADISRALFDADTHTTTYRHVLQALDELETEEMCVQSMTWRVATPGMALLRVFWLTERLLTREETHGD